MTEHCTFVRCLDSPQSLCYTISPSTGCKMLCSTFCHFRILKDILPKNENSVIIYSPSSSSKPVWMSLFWTQRKIFWRKFVTRMFWGTIDFHSRKTYYGSQWCPRTALFVTFFRISYFVFSWTKNFIQTWNYLRVSKLHNFHFWVNYPFKFCFCSYFGESNSKVIQESFNTLQFWESNIVR